MIRRQEVSIEQDGPVVRRVSASGEDQPGWFDRRGPLAARQERDDWDGKVEQKSCNSDDDEARSQHRRRVISHDDEAPTQAEGYQQQEDDEKELQCRAAKPPASQLAERPHLGEAIRPVLVGGVSGFPHLAPKARANICAFSSV